MSDDASVYVFSTYEELVPTDVEPTTLDIYAHDRSSETYELLTVDSDEESLDGNPGAPVITPDGRFVAFALWHSSMGIVIRDRELQTTDVINIPVQGGMGPVSLSADGRYVTFASGSALAPGDTHGSMDAYLFDRTTREFEQVSIASGGGQGVPLPTVASYRAAPISRDGRFVVFSTDMAGLVPGDTNGVDDVFLRDRALGTTTRLSVGSAGAQVTGYSYNPAISGDGTFATFVSSAPDLVPDDSGDRTDLFGVDLSTGVVSLLSRTPAGLPGDGETAGSSSLSYDGMQVAFVSAANDLVPGSGPDSVPEGSPEWKQDASDIFVLDRETGLITLASVDHRGTEDVSGYGFGGLQLSGDGSHVLFDTNAWLAPNEEGTALQDIYLRRVDAPTVQPGTGAPIATGASADVAVTGSGFRPGLVLDGPAGVVDVTEVDHNTIAATVAVPPDSAEGPVALTVTDEHGCTAVVEDAYEVHESAGEFTPVEPARILDTRYDGVPMQPGQAIDLRVTGTAGVPQDVEAVAINVTVTGPTSAGYLVLHPTGSALPATSSINFTPGVTVANLAMPRVGNEGSVSIVNPVGTVHVIVDVLGFYASADGPHGSRLLPLFPDRVLDTRGLEQGPLQEGEMLDLQVGAGVSAVLANVTVDVPTDDGFVTAWPGAGELPVTSTVNFRRGQTVANVAVIPVTDNGWISFYNQVGETHLIVDVLGVYLDPTEADDRYESLDPARILDTRQGEATPLRSGDTLWVPVVAAGGVPSDATAAVVNLTGVATSAAGYFTLHPAGEARPESSNLNLVPGKAVANLAVVPLGQDGAVELYNYGGSAHLIVDVIGYFH